jgi:hypothetical protein
MHREDNQEGLIDLGAVSAETRGTGAFALDAETGLKMVHGLTDD